MAQEIKQGPGVIERIPSAEEIDQRRLYSLLIKMFEEIKAEIDALWAYVNNEERAKQTWEVDDVLTRHEERKKQVREILTRLK